VYIAGLDGQTLANTTGPIGGTQTLTWQITNLHGDIVTFATDGLSTPNGGYNCQDEYGNPDQGNTPARYGWLGGKQRSTDSLAGLVLMGLRLYDPVTGRFLSPDPVFGGNPNNYAYPVDPINQFDVCGSYRDPLRPAPTCPCLRSRTVTVWKHLHSKTNWGYWGDTSAYLPLWGSLPSSVDQIVAIEVGVTAVAWPAVIKVSAFHLSQTSLIRANNHHDFYLLPAQSHGGRDWSFSVDCYPLAIWGGGIDYQPDSVYLGLSFRVSYAFWAPVTEVEYYYG